MRKLIVSPKFRRAYRRIAKRDSFQQECIDGVLKQMEKDVFSPELGTHKLSGTLSGLWACSCGYDCRIVFSFEIDRDNGSEAILLIDVGTHDEVY